MSVRKRFVGAVLAFVVSAVTVDTREQSAHFSLALLHRRVGGGVLGADTAYLFVRSVQRGEQPFGVVNAFNLNGLLDRIFPATFVFFDLGVDQVRAVFSLMARPRRGRSEVARCFLAVLILRLLLRLRELLLGFRQPRFQVVDVCIVAHFLLLCFFAGFVARVFPHPVHVHSSLLQ